MEDSIDMSLGTSASFTVVLATSFPAWKEQTINSLQVSESFHGRFLNYKFLQIRNKRVQRAKYSRNLRNIISRQEGHPNASAA